MRILPTCAECRLSNTNRTQCRNGWLLWRIRKSPLPGAARGRYAKITIATGLVYYFHQSLQLMPTFSRYGRENKFNLLFIAGRCPPKSIFLHQSSVAVHPSRFWTSDGLCYERSPFCPEPDPSASSIASKYCKSRQGQFQPDRTTRAPRLVRSFSLLTPGCQWESTTKWRGLAGWCIFRNWDLDLHIHVGQSVQSSPPVTTTSII